MGRGCYLEDPGCGTAKRPGKPTNVDGLDPMGYILSDALPTENLLCRPHDEQFIEYWITVTVGSKMQEMLVGDINLHVI